MIMLALSQGAAHEVCSVIEIKIKMITETMMNVSKLKW